MCNRVDNYGLSLKNVSQALEAEIAEGNYFTSKEVNAFERPAIPIVLEHEGRKITHGTWGIQKEIAKDHPGQGINLKAENSWTYYKKVQHNRCVVPVTGFYDWMHITNPGKKTPIKVKHRMHWKDADEFYIGAYYDVWENKEIGFGLVTTAANELMSIVHNSKLRMVIAMDARTADRFLKDDPIESFTYPEFDPQLVAVNLEPHKIPQTLFDE